MLNFKLRSKAGRTGTAQYPPKPCRLADEGTSSPIVIRATQVHDYAQILGPALSQSTFAQPDEAWAFRQSACECFCLRYGDPGSLASSFERSLRRKAAASC